MNLRAFDERTARSKSPKRYSLNRKTKERERKKTTDSQEFGTHSSYLPSRIPDRAKCGNELPSYEMKRDNGMRSGTIHSQLPFAIEKKKKKNRWPFCAPIQFSDNTTIPCSPGDFSGISSQLNNRPRINAENLCYTQVPYTNFTPHYTNHLGSFQGTQTLQSQISIQNGVGCIGFPQGNPFVQPYMTPIQTGGGFYFDQINMQSNDVYSAFTTYGNPFGVVWRQN